MAMKKGECKHFFNCNLFSEIVATKCTMSEWMFDVADKMMESRNMGKWTDRIF